MSPWLSFYTPTYRRPRALARCLASVQAQTIVHDLEHVVIPDHVGHGVDGMFARIPLYAKALRGDYVHIMADDDELADPSVCERVRAFAKAHNYPDVILVSVNKGGLALPQGQPWPPVCGAIDLGCVITRRDIWEPLALAGAYPAVYEADYWFADALHKAGHQALMSDVFFLRGAVSRGEAEAAA